MNAYISQRVWPRPIAILNAWDFSKCCVSSFADSACLVQGVSTIAILRSTVQPGPHFLK